jgi:hypothetical protein
MADPIPTPAESDGAEAFESKETSHQLPVGWVLLALGLIAWGLWYAWAYSPATTGWTQEAAYQQQVAAEAKK